MPKKVEKCGRCSASTVVEFTQLDKDEDEIRAKDPFANERIEVEESDLRRVNPGGWFADVSARIDDVATRIIWR